MDTVTLKANELVWLAPGLAVTGASGLNTGTITNTTHIEQSPASTINGTDGYVGRSGLRLRLLVRMNPAPTRPPNTAPPKSERRSPARDSAAPATAPTSPPTAEPRANTQKKPSTALT